MCGYKAQTHQFVLFDEASTSLVLSYKKMCQISATWVALGELATHMYSYEIWVHGVRMIVAVNRWQVELKSLPEADAAWLQRNSVYVDVQQPLWVSR